MNTREIVFRGGVAKLDKPKGQRPSEAKVILKASINVNRHKEKVTTK
jgi:hypothetical protein